MPAAKIPGSSDVPQRTRRGLCSAACFSYYVRPGELRQAEWAEVDFKSSQWRIPARRMKARRPHIVPLSRQAKRLFRQVRRITGSGATSSPALAQKAESYRSTCAPMLQSIGFGGEITMSGFRSMAATLLSEQGWNADAIERQLSHLDPSPRAPGVQLRGIPTGAPPHDASVGGLFGPAGWAQAKVEAHDLAYEPFKLPSR